MATTRLMALVCLLSPGLATSCRKSVPSPQGVAVREMEAGSSGAVLHVRAAGDPERGRVLVAVHGGPGMSSDYMLSLEELAGEDLAVVTYDQRGTGRSRRPADGYAMERYVEDLEAVRRAVGADRIHLFGHSWGGLVALRYAVSHPERTSSIILMGSAAPSMDALNRANTNKARRVVELQQRGAIPWEILSLADLMPCYYFNPGFDAPDELRNLYHNGEVEQKTWAALGDDDLAADLGRLFHPVLLLWGEGDPFGAEMVDATQRALPNAQVEIVFLKECGHFWHECPDRFYEHVRSFLHDRTE